MLCAGDARIVVAHRLLAAIAERSVSQIEPSHQIALDGSLVLRDRRQDGGAEDGSLGVKLVTVIKHAARRFGARISCPCPPYRRDGGLVRFVIALDEAQRLVAGVERLDAAHDDITIGIGADRREARIGGHRASERGKLVEIKRVARERADQIRAAPANARVQGCQMRDLLFFEIIVVIAGDDYQGLCWRRSGPR